MIKHLTFILLLCTIVSNSQNVIPINNASHSESSYPPRKLIEEVFLYGECSTVSNFSYQAFGSYNDLQNKSYGYFEKGNTNFPFKNGIVITNGTAFRGGNKYVSNGKDDDDPDRVSKNNQMKGDDDLETVLNKDETYDATFFKFSFVPTKGTLSFRFILASEEYDGDKECLFSDSFAFLLREKGKTTYKNLAVLPTGEPISVTTINNSENCRANPQYFEGYNVKQTNYDGRTKVLNAKAQVIPGREYEIKLVIADQRDSKWDSAIFLEGESFNFHADVNLGQDITLENKNAPCEGEAVRLDTKLPTNLGFKWFKDRMLLDGENKPHLYAREKGEYTVEVSYGTCSLTDKINLEYVPSANLDNVLDLFACDDGTGSAIFDLTKNNTLIFDKLNAKDFKLNFYESLSDAISNINPITNPNTFKGINEQKIYVKTEHLNNFNTCPDYGFFTLKIKNLSINKAPNMELCDDVSNNGVEAFDLETQKNLILGDLANSNITVSYYATANDATNNINALKSPYSNIKNNQPIYVRLQANDAIGCYLVSQNPVFNLIVIEYGNPEFDITPKCYGADAVILGDKNGTFSFDPQPNDGAQINTKTGQITNAIPSESYTVKYATSGKCSVFKTKTVTILPLDDSSFIITPTCNGAQVNITGQKGGTFSFASPPIDNAIINPSTGEITGGSYNTAYTIRYTSATFCETQTEKTFTTLPEDDASFTLKPTCSGAIATITGNTGGTFSFVTAPQDNAIINSKTGEISKNTPGKTYQVKYTTKGPCISSSVKSVTTYEIALANSDQQPISITKCDDNVELEPISINKTVFDLTSLNNSILDGQNPTFFKVSYFENINDIDNLSNAIKSPSQYTNKTNPQVIYARVDNNTLDTDGNDKSPCYATTQLTLTVNPLPPFQLKDTYSLCHDTNGSEVSENLIIDTGLSSTNFVFEWFYNNTTIGTDNSIEIKAIGEYSVKVTNVVTGCEFIDTTLVKYSSPPIIYANTTKTDFSTAQDILVTANGDGIYEFSLNSGPWQSNTPNTNTYVFKNVPPGVHEIIVRDRNGCGLITTTITVLGYPPFFTPNNDSYHDTWKIHGIEAFPNAKIYIFNRYGKLIKQISPFGSGWDGTLNGTLLPAADYWFVIDFNDNNNQSTQKIKGHFTLKR